MTEKQVDVELKNITEQLTTNCQVCGFMKPCMPEGCEKFHQFISDIKSLFKTQAREYLLESLEDELYSFLDKKCLQRINKNIDSKFK